jgi:hypothetical protein
MAHHLIIRRVLTTAALQPSSMEVPSNRTTPCTTREGHRALTLVTIRLVIGMINLIFQLTNKDLLRTNQLVSCLLY